MSAEFSAILSTLRKEKGISQKEAAENLGISQALLSHYEKGIRECSLDFVKKASEYYDVTSDYLLGLSDKKHAFSELLSQDDLPSDSGLNPKTLLRCIIYLSEAAERSGDTEQIFFDDYFALCIRKYISAIKTDKKISVHLCDMLIATIIDETRGQITGDNAKTELPLALKTVIQHSSMLFNKKIAEFM